MSALSTLYDHHTNHPRTRASSFRPSFLLCFSLSLHALLTALLVRLQASARPLLLRPCSLPSPQRGFSSRACAVRLRTELSSIHDSLRRDDAQTLDSRTARVLPPDGSPAAAVTASGKFARRPSRERVSKAFWIGILYLPNLVHSLSVGLRKTHQR